jgi:uncharacterized membrane protein YkoI
MLKRFQSAIIVLLASAVLVCSAQQRRLNREMAHLPPAVRKAIRAQVGDGQLDSIEKNTEDGEVSYDVEMVLDGKTRGFTVDDQGELLDKEVFLDELPPAVQRTIQKQTGKWTLDEIDKSVEDGETSYDVQIVLNDKTRGFTVDGDGELLDEEVFPGELPPAVRQTILKEAGAGTLGEIDKSVEDGETTYDAEITSDGKTRHITVDAKGTLLDTEVFLADLPAALQTAIQKQAGGDPLDEITKCFDDGEISYEVEVTGNTGSRTLSFNADGELLSTKVDVHLADTPEAVQTQIKSLTGGGKLLGISKSTEDNEIYYDVDIENGGAEKTVSLDPDGKIIPDDDGK